MATIRRARGVLKVNKKNVRSVTNKATKMETGFSNNSAIFVTPNPPIASLQNQIAAVGKAQNLVLTRVVGAASARDVQLGILVGMLETGLGYTQGLADAAATYAQAAAIIEAAGLSVAAPPTRTKDVLGVTQAAPGGPVALVANVGALAGRTKKKTQFNWEYTADGGKTFIAMPSTPKCTTTLANLTPLSTYGFRVNVTDSDGIAGPWSQIVSFLVH
jgi:hypothetical protein